MPSLQSAVLLEWCQDPAWRRVTTAGVCARPWASQGLCSLVPGSSLLCGHLCTSQGVVTVTRVSPRKSCWPHPVSIFLITARGHAASASVHWDLEPRHSSEWSPQSENSGSAIYLVSRICAPLPSASPPSLPLFSPCLLPFHQALIPCQAQSWTLANQGDERHQPCPPEGHSPPQETGVVRGSPSAGGTAPEKHPAPWESGEASQHK